jgi:hypothetical protein
MSARSTVDPEPGRVPARELRRQRRDVVAVVPERSRQNVATVGDQGAPRSPRPVGPLCVRVAVTSRTTAAGAPSANAGAGSRCPGRGHAP